MRRMPPVAVLAAALLLLAPSLVASRHLRGAGPAYWQQPARFPMHYPAAAAAVEGYVVNPMGGASYCNARLVKPGEEHSALASGARTAADAAPAALGAKALAS